MDDSDSVTSEKSERPKRHHSDVTVPYEEIREAVYKALEEKEKEKPKSVGGYAMAGVGFVGIAKAIYDNLPFLQKFFPKVQGFLSMSEGSQPQCCASELPISPSPSLSCVNYDAQVQNDNGFTRSGVIDVTQEEAC